MTRNVADFCPSRTITSSGNRASRVSWLVSSTRTAARRRRGVELDRSRHDASPLGALGQGQRLEALGLDGGSVQHRDTDADTEDEKADAKVSGHDAV